MIITNIIGGLGNQLFQYAAAYRLAKIHNCKLFLDISDYAKYPDRKFELSHFNISGSILNSKEKFWFIKNQKKSVYKRIVSIIARIEKRTIVFYVKEPYFHFFPDLVKTPIPCYIEGYWQSEKYFLDIKHDLVKEFTLNSPISEVTLRCMKRIRKSNSICIHIRRGDYVSNMDANTFHGLCSLKYYYNGVEQIRQHIDSPVFFVFSDDSEWVRKNFCIDEPTYYITHNGIDKAYEDLYLMSQCSHHIIANSSFSWWGAWLGEKKGQIVIAPKPWFNYQYYNYDDIIPERWITIEKGDDYQRN